MGIFCAKDRKSPLFFCQYGQHVRQQLVESGERVQRQVFIRCMAAPDGRTHGDGVQSRQSLGEEAALQSRVNGLDGEFFSEEGMGECSVKAQPG